MRLSAVAVAICFSVACWSHADDSHASIKQETHIPPQPLGTALQTLAKDRGFQVVYLTEDVRELKTPGAVGDLTVDEALNVNRRARRTSIRRPTLTRVGWPFEELYGVGFHLMEGRGAVCRVSGRSSGVF